MASGESLRNEYAHFLVMNDRDLLRRTLGALNIDVSAMACVQRSEEGSRVFSEQITAIEGEFK
jgi:hypothetical protein